MAADDYDAIIHEAALNWNVDPRLLKAVMLQESKGDPAAVSKAGARGLMQIMPDTGKQLGMTDLHDPTQSIWAGAKYLAQALDAEKTPQDALRFYHGGPNWRQSYGPESRDYVPGVAKHYAALAPKEQPATPAETPTQPDAAGAQKVTDDEFLRSTGATTPASKGAEKPQKAPGTASDDEFLKATGAAPAAPQTQETAPQKPGTTTASGVARNVAAGVLEGEGSVINMMSDPFGNLIARPLLIAGGTAFDAVAHALGYQGMTPEQRADLYGDDKAYPQPGTRAINALGSAIGANPEDVTPNSEAERLARKAATTGTMLATVGPTGVRGIVPAATVGAGGGVAGDVAAQYVPEWAQPSVELAGNMLGSFGTMMGLKGAQGGVNALASGVTRFAEGPGPRPPNPLAAPATPPAADLATQIAEAQSAIERTTVNTPERAAARTRLESLIAQRDAAATQPQSGGATPAGREAVPGQPTQATGAQVTTAPIPEKTPAQRITDLEKSVTQTAEDRAGPQMRDDTPYVKDIPPRTLAAREFHPRNSGDEKRAIAKDDAFRKEVEDLRRDRNNGMVDKLREDAQDANALDAAHEARQQVSPAELGVFENEQPTSVAGLAARIDKLLSGPEGKQRAVRTTLEDVKKSLYDADGNLETLPSRIYGARKNLTDLLKRGAKGVGDVADDVRASKHVLESLLSDFDEAITKGASGFQEYLKQWSELSRPIDQMEFLQQYQTGSKKITDKDGYLIPTKVQKMLDDILQGHKAKGVNKAKSLTDEQIANIEAVRNELAADSLKDRMTAVKGSDTFQQFMQEAKAPGRIATGLKIAGELGIGIPTAGLGNFVLQRGLTHLEKRAVAKAAAAEAARKRELLSPPNPLNQP